MHNGITFMQRSYVKQLQPSGLKLRTLQLKVKVSGTKSRSCLLLLQQPSGLLLLLYCQLATAASSQSQTLCQRRWGGGAVGTSTPKDILLSGIFSHYQSCLFLYCSATHDFLGNGDDFSISLFSYLKVKLLALLISYCTFMTALPSLQEKEGAKE